MGEFGDREARTHIFPDCAWIPHLLFRPTIRSAPLKTSMNNVAYPEILSDLSYRLSERLVKNGIAKNQAETIAADVTVYVSQHWGGQLIYFPKATKFNMANRDLEICKKWNGRNALELCREYDLTKARLYQILKPPRKKRVDG